MARKSLLRVLDEDVDALIDRVDALEQSGTAHNLSEIRLSILAAQGRIAELERTTKRGDLAWLDLERRVEALDLDLDRRVEALERAEADAIAARDALAKQIEDAFDLAYVAVLVTRAGFFGRLRWLLTGDPR